jgi:hypothetical protein
MTQNASSWWRHGTAVPSADVAHDGDTSLKLEIGASCESASARQTITIPAGAPKPAIRFWYQTDGSSTSSATVQGRTLPSSEGEWTEEVICLEAQTADTPQQILLSFQFAGGACPGAASRVYFDSFEVLEDTKRPCQ